MEHNDEEMRYFVANTDILHDAEKVYKIREDLKKGICLKDVAGERFFSPPINCLNSTRFLLTFG